MENEYMLTTFDNPFNPFEQFDSWFLFDVEKGYNTCSRLDRIAKTSDSMSEKEKEDAMNNAIDEIIKYDFLHVYRRVTPKDFTN